MFIGRKRKLWYHVVYSLLPHLYTHGYADVTSSPIAIHIQNGRRFITYSQRSIISISQHFNLMWMRVFLLSLSLTLILTLSLSVSRSYRKWLLCWNYKVRKSTVRHTVGRVDFELLNERKRKWNQNSNCTMWFCEPFFNWIGFQMHCSLAFTMACHCV